MSINCDQEVNQTCNHCYTIDLIDIDPDKSLIVYSCDYCGDIQLTLPTENNQINKDDVEST